jgi:uncharacterized protein
MNNTEEKRESCIVIYHGGCPDGIGGAWAFWRVNKDTIEYFPGKFHQEPPDVTGKHVFFVDFTYSLEVTKQMSKTAKSITVLDHHKSASPLLQLMSADSGVGCKFNITLNMNLSGAQIAWDYMNPGEDRPWFINDIGDRDTWKWEVPDSKASTTAMSSDKYYDDFETFDKLSNLPRQPFVTYGNIILNEYDRIHKRICSNAIDCMVSTPDGKQSYKCRVVECNSMFASDVGNMLVQDGKCDFSVMYRYLLEHNTFNLSLRAKKGSNIDLTTLVKPLFGNGGGHALASGATLFESEGQTLKSLFKPVDKDARFHLDTPPSIVMDQHNISPDEPDQPMSDIEKADSLKQESLTRAASV